MSLEGENAKLKKIAKEYQTVINLLKKDLKNEQDSKQKIAEELTRERNKTAALKEQNGVCRGDEVD